MKFYWRFFVIATIILSFFYAFQLGNSFVYAYTSTSWTKTSGTVIKSFSTPDSFSESGVSYHFEYNYTVNGKTYTSSAIRVRNDYVFNLYNDFDTQNLVQHFPVGSSITIFYNPAHPSDSALHTGLAFSNYLALTIIIIILISFLKSFFVYDKILDVQKFANSFDKISVSYLYLVTVFSFLTGFTIFLLLGLFSFGLIFLSLDSFLIYIFLELVSYVISVLHINEVLSQYFNFLITCIFLYALARLIIKTIYSLKVKKYINFVYKIQSKQISQDTFSKKWILSINGSFNQNDKKILFNHTVKKKFTSESKALEFYKNYIKPINKQSKEAGIEKRVYIPDISLTITDNIILDYQINSTQRFLLNSYLFVLYTWNAILFLYVGIYTLQGSLNNIINRNFIAEISLGINEEIITSLLLIIIIFSMLVEIIIFLIFLYYFFEYFVNIIYKSLFTKEIITSERDNN